MQAVHDPFSDADDSFSDGVDASYMDASTYSYLLTSFGNTKHQVPYPCPRVFLICSFPRPHLPASCHPYISPPPISSV